MKFDFGGGGKKWEWGDPGHPVRPIPSRARKHGVGSTGNTAPETSAGHTSAANERSENKRPNRNEISHLTSGYCLDQDTQAGPPAFRGRVRSDPGPSQGKKDLPA